MAILVPWRSFLANKIAASLSQAKNKKFCDNFVSLFLYIFFLHGRNKKIKNSDLFLDI